MSRLAQAALGAALLLAASPDPSTAAVAAQPIGPPGGLSQTAAVSSDGRTLYVATLFAGLFRSADQGATWSRLPGQPPGRLASLAVSTGEARTVYAATSEGLFQSLDSGSSWLALNPRVPGVNGCKPSTQACGRGVAVLADPLHGDSVLAVFADAGLLYRSDDAGESWTRAREGLSSLFVNQLVAVPARPGTYYAATDHGVRVSRDGGATWSASGLKPSNVVNVAVDAGSEEAAYAISTYVHHYAGLVHVPWRRDRGTADFSFLTGDRFFPNFQGNVEFAADPFTPGTAFATTSGGTYRTPDRGLSWLRTDERPSQHPFPAFGAPGTLIAQTGPNEGTPLVVSTDDGESWKPVGPGVGAQTARQVAFDPTRPQTIYVRTAYGAIRRSEDGGATWRRVFAPGRYDDPAQLAVDPFDPARLVLATPEGIYRSGDRGATWSLRIEGYWPAVIADPARPGAYIALSPFGGVLQSTDGGATWTRANALLERWPFANFAQALPGGGSALYTGALDLDGYRRTHLWKSTDGGFGWTPILTLRQPEANLTAIAGVSGQPKRLFAAFANVTGFLGPLTDGGVYRTADGGISWQLARLGKDRAPALSLALDPAEARHLFAGSTLGRIFESRDGGATWTPLPAILPAAEVRDLEIRPSEPGILFAALEGASVFRLELNR